MTTNIVFIHSFKNLSKYHIHLFIRLKICQNIVFINSFIKKNAIISYSFIHSLKNLPKYHIRLFIHLKVWYNIVFIHSFIYDISRYHARLHQAEMYQARYQLAKFRFFALETPDIHIAGWQSAVVTHLSYLRIWICLN